MALRETLRAALNNSNKIVEQIESSQFGGNDYENREITRRWGIVDAAELVGVSRQAIVKAENEGRLPPADRRDSNMRAGYTIYQIETMRQVFGKNLTKADDEEAVVIAVTGQKGGGWKTASAVHLAQWTALKGYRTLLIDHDPQGTSSLYHGLSKNRIPDSDTILPWYLGEKPDLGYAIHSTYWPRLDLIPSNPSVDRVKIELPQAVSNGFIDIPPHLILSEGVATIKDDYDIIIIDGTPDLSDITVNMAFAADIILCPTPAAFADYMSTSSFFEMLLALVEGIDDQGVDPLVRALITHMDPNPRSQSSAMEKIIRSCWGGMVMSNTLKKSEEVPKAQLKMRTVFEQAVSQRSTHGAYKKSLAIFEPVFNEILDTLVIPHWPSRQEEKQL